MTAAALWREAMAAGVRFRLDAGVLRLSADSAPPAEMLARLREHKAAITDILKADRCCWCAERLAWPGPVGVTFADGTAECMCCADSEVERIWRAAERVTNQAALADEAETLGGPVP